MLTCRLVHIVLEVLKSCLHTIMLVRNYLCLYSEVSNRNHFREAKHNV